MKAPIVLIEMIFLHFIADYYLQGILASMKQKEWWRKQLTQTEWFSGKYKNDYLQALYAHSFEWTFMTLLPILIKVYKLNFNVGPVIVYLILFLSNLLAHFLTDDLKANEHTINLNQDQGVHAIQIFLTFLIWTVLFGWV